MASYGDDLRRWSMLRSELSLESLHERIAERFGFRCIVKYRDEDGDSVSLMTDADMEEALCCITTNRLHLILSEPTNAHDVTEKASGETSTEKGQQAPEGNTGKKHQVNHSLPEKEVSVKEIK